MSTTQLFQEVKGLLKSTGFDLSPEEESYLSSAAQGGLRPLRISRIYL